MRIAYRQGEEPVRKKRKFDKEVEDFKKLFITDHNRKFERERNKQAQRVSTN